MLFLFWLPNIRKAVGYPMHLPYNKSKFIIICSDFKHTLIYERKKY